MWNKLMITAVLFIGSSLGIFLQAQDLQEDIKKMNAAYEKIEQIHTKIKVEARQEGKIVYSQHIELKKQGDKQLFISDQIETMVNEEYRISVNKGAKVLFFSPRNLAEEKRQKKALMDEIGMGAVDSLLKSIDTENFQFLGTEKGLKHYRIHSPDKMIVETEMFIDPNTGLLRKLYYSYNTEMYPAGMSASVDYTVLNLNPVFTSNVFDQSRYVKITAQEVKPTGLYQHYELIDATEFDEFE